MPKTAARVITSQRLSQSSRSHSAALRLGIPLRLSARCSRAPCLPPVTAAARTCLLTEGCSSGSTAVARIPPEASGPALLRRVMKLRRAQPADPSCCTDDCGVAIYEQELDAVEATPESLAEQLSEDRPLECLLGG